MIATDEGSALVKYIGNSQGCDALICDLVGTELARLMGLYTPEFAVMAIPSFEISKPIIQTEAGPAFCSKWIDEAHPLSPNARLLNKLRNKGDIAKLVVFDTWIRNSDRCPDVDNPNDRASNWDNLLFAPDKRMVQMIVIDHTHIFVEGTLEDDLGNDDFITEEVVFGLFDQFKPHLNHIEVRKSLDALASIDRDTIWEILGIVPQEWGLTEGMKENLVEFLIQRAIRLPNWLPTLMFDQAEMNV